MHGDAPAAVDLGQVRGELRDGWGIDGAELVYLPVGGGGYHWRAVDAGGTAHFVTVDDLVDKEWLGDDLDARARGLADAFAAAAWLREGAGIDAVLSPTPALDGAPLRRLDRRFTLSVAPHVEARAGEFGPHHDPDRRAQVVDLLIRLHSVPPPAGLLRIPAPEVGPRADLDAFLADPGARWEGGPLGEPAREVLLPHVDELVARLQSLDRAGASLGDGDLVLTHGEPHGGNVLDTGERILLIDWDTVAVAPPERDLWIVGMDAADVARYETATGRTVRPDVFELYAERWALDDIGCTVRMFRAPHDDVDETRRWLELMPDLLPDRR